MGLRTLVFGIRELNNSEFEQWHLAFEAASTAIIGRAALLRKVANNVENSLTILGASAIEDKLQQGVPEAIESLRTAGIKAWVLTGDKQETAISIGYSSKQSSRKSLEDALVASKKLTITSGITHNTGASDAAAVNPVALIIDGTSLVHILDSELEELVLACEFTFIFLFFMAMVLCADVVYSFGCSSLN
jgi:phospholipid-transporting ATPase